MTEDYLLLENDHDHSYVFHTVYDRVYSRDQGLILVLLQLPKIDVPKYTQKLEKELQWATVSWT